LYTASMSFLRSDIDFIPPLKKVVLQPIVRDLQLRLSDLPLSLRCVRLAPSVPGLSPKLELNIMKIGSPNSRFM